jgi:hypothetical protein
VEGHRGGDVDVGHAVAVSEAEGFVILDVFAHALQASAGQGALAGIDQGHLPWLGIAAVHFHGVVVQVEGHVRGMQEVVGEELLDHITLVAAADDELVDAVRRIALEDVPEDRLAADFDHRLGLDRCLFTEPCA